MKRVLSFFLSLIIIISVGGVTAFANDLESRNVQFDYNAADIVYNGCTYIDYLKEFSSAKEPSDTIVLEAEDNISDSLHFDKLKTDFEGMQGVSVYTDNDDLIEWEFIVKEEGFYNILFTYYPVEGNGSAIERCLYINDVIPFSEAQRLSLSRIWSNSSEKISLDTQGNQIMIEQVEASEWTTQYAIDSSGISNEPLRFYFKKGKNKLSLKSVVEPLILKSVTLLSVSKAETKDYKSVSADYNLSSSAKDDIVLQAEQADRKSTQMLYPLSDQTSPDVIPYSPYEIVYNTIGRNQWTNPGQWIEWDFNVKQDGYYALSAHFKQALKDSRASVRIVEIDGKVPFIEAKNWVFSYDTSWQTTTFSNNDKPYLFYLKEGKHTIRLTVGLGEYADIIANAFSYLTELNSIYRSIISVSGASPDQYRDYKFDEMIPETIEQMAQISKTLKNFEKKVVKIEKDATTVPDIKRVYDQIDMMLEDTDTISVRLSSFKDNIASFGTWINTQRGQPLELDWISFTPYNLPKKQEKASFFSVVVHNIKRFLYSFTVDYQTIGQTDINTNRKIKVWMTTSQDQSQLLRQLIMSDFSQNKGISAEVQLVSTKALLPAILAHKGPDVSLGIGQADVNNLAIRNAICDLTQFSDLDEKKQDFYSCSLAPFEWQEGLYALPETMVWPMLFYRKDILSEMGIKASELETWDSILNSVLPKLKKSSLTFGILPTIQNYLNFLYQQGGQLYTSDGRNSALSSSEAIESMKLFSILYTQYGFPLSYEFSNRFRTGEMPIAIADFTSYNNLMLFASEIKGLWGMLPIPATIDESGTANHTAVCTVTASVIMADSKDLDASWEFLKWWTSTQTQNSFGKLLEAVVGTSSRYNTANKKAIAMVSWDPDMKESMLYQVENLMEYPEVPGGYFTARLFNFAYRSIVYENKAVRESMDDVANNINLEMANKRKEYGID